MPHKFMDANVSSIIYKAIDLTALVPRNLIFGRGMKPVKLESTISPTGTTECGSYPKTADTEALVHYLKDSN